MANVKGRIKAPKSASSRRGRRNSKQSLTGVKKASDSAKSVIENSVPRKPPDLTELENCVPRKPADLTVLENCVPRKPGELTALQQVLMQNEPIDFDKCTEKLLKLSQPPKVPKKRIRKSVEKIPRFATRSGRLIGPRTKGGIKMIDNILKGEMMIEIELPTKRIETSFVTSVINNNEMGISDQNGTHNLPIPQSTNESKKKPEVKGKNKPTYQMPDHDSKPGIQTRSKFILPIKKENTKRPASKPKSRNTKSSTAKLSKKKAPIKNGHGKIIKRNKLNDKTVKTKQVTLSNGLVLTLALFQCDYCQKMFSSKASLRRHMYIHLNLQPHRCKKCSKKFRYKMHLDNHINKHHKELHNIEPMLCQICDKEFLLQENLELHLSTHIKNENSFKCVYCDKKFSYHLLLTQHEKQHLLTGKYQCSVCQLSFDSINRLKFHMKTHLKIKDYICQHCGKEFLRMNSLRRHVQICHSGHRLQCPVCKKKLKGHLTEHMRTHKQARPHKCDQCERRFTQSTQLNVHRRSHTGERPFVCKICNIKFTHSNTLMMHIRRHTGEKPFQCTICPLSFSQLPHMKTHLIKIHKQDTPYKCSKCDEFFKMKKQVDHHQSNCKVGERELTFEEKIQASVQYEEVKIDNPMNISRMRYLIALLLTMVANEKSLKFLGA